jgi:hypothetical protein
MEHQPQATYIHTLIAAGPANGGRSTGQAPGGLALRPTDPRVNHYSCRSREVINHWAKRGRPRQTSEPLLPSPRQLQIDLAPDPQLDL